MTSQDFIIREITPADNAELANVVRRVILEMGAPKIGTAYEDAATDNMFETYQKEYPFSQIFNAAFILSIFSFIFPNLLFFILLILISGINYSNLNWRNLAIACIGLITPYFFYFIYTFLFDKAFYFPEFETLQFIKFPTLNAIALPKLIWLFTLLLISLFSLIELRVGNLIN